MAYRKPHINIIEDCNCNFDGELCMNMNGCHECDRCRIPEDEDDEDLL